jgi:integrase
VADPRRRRALTRGEIGLNPTIGLELPAIRGRRDRIAMPEGATALLAALERDRALGATAMYAGLRLGELMALDWEHVDLDNDRVKWSWDPEGSMQAGGAELEGRSPYGPGPGRASHVLERAPARYRTLPRVCVRPRSRAALCAARIYDRADGRWTDAGLQRIRPHECRHTFASFMIAAGVNAKARSRLRRREGQVEPQCRPVVRRLQ